MTNSKIRFREQKRQVNTIKKYRSVYGVGTNDADYAVSYTYAGSVITCPFYSKWYSMMQRCYSDKFKKTHPSYILCKTSKEWLLFSNFKNWMKSQNWQGMELDKDLKIKGNKIYSEDTCLLIPSKLNVLLSFSEAKNHSSVYLNNRNKKIKAIAETYQEPMRGFINQHIVTQAIVA